MASTSRAPSVLTATATDMILPASRIFTHVASIYRYDHEPSIGRLRKACTGSSISSQSLDVWLFEMPALFMAFTSFEPHERTLPRRRPSAPPPTPSSTPGSPGSSCPCAASGSPGRRFPHAPPRRARGSFTLSGARGRSLAMGSAGQALDLHVHHAVGDVGPEEIVVRALLKAGLQAILSIVVLSWLRLVFATRTNLDLGHDLPRDASCGRSGEQTTRGVALRSAYGLPPPNAVTPPPTSSPGTPLSESL